MPLPENPGPLTTIEATVEVRRGEGFTVRDAGELIDGIRHRFRFAWPLTDEKGGIYEGETAWTPHPWSSEEWPWEHGPIWVASGDLIDVAEVRE